MLAICARLAEPSGLWVTARLLGEAPGLRVSAGLLRRALRVTAGLLRVATGLLGLAAGLRKTAWLLWIAARRRVLTRLLSVTTGLLRPVRSRWLRWVGHGGPLLMTGAL